MYHILFLRVYKNLWFCNLFKGSTSINELFRIIFSFQSNVSCSVRQLRPWGGKYCFLIGLHNALKTHVTRKQTLRFLSLSYTKRRLAWQWQRPLKGLFPGDAHLISLCMGVPWLLVPFKIKPVSPSSQNYSLVAPQINFQCSLNSFGFAL